VISIQVKVREAEGICSRSPGLLIPFYGPRHLEKNGRELRFQGIPPEDSVLHLPDLAPTGWHR